MNTCFIFGSGATRGSGSKLIASGNLPPSDEKFFEEVLIDPDRYPALCLLRKYKKYNSLEKTFSLIDTAHKFRAEELLITELTSELLQYFDFSFYREFIEFFEKREKEYVENKRFAKFNELKAETAKHYFTGHVGTELRMLLFQTYSQLDYFGNLLDKLFARAYSSGRRYDVISFNYDLLAEKCLERIGGHRYLGHGGSSFYDPIRPFVLKLHGSLNWLEQGFDLPIIQQDLFIEPYYDENTTFKFRQPAIVPPIIDKNLLSTPKTNLQLLINQQWAYAESLIAEATHLIFVGYSFPETDKHATDFFQRICKYSRPKVVTGCYKGSNARLKKILEGFGKAYELDSNGLESFVSNFNFENFFAMVAE